MFISMKKFKMYNYSDKFSRAVGLFSIDITFPIVRPMSTFLWYGTKRTYSCVEKQRNVKSLGDLWSERSRQTLDQRLHQCRGGVIANLLWIPQVRSTLLPLILGRVFFFTSIAFYDFDFLLNFVGIKTIRFDNAALSTILCAREHFFVNTIFR